MVNFIIGLLLGVVFFIAFLFAAYVGYKCGYEEGSKSKPQTVTKNEEAAKRMQEMYKSFVEIMNYDVNKALQRRVNNNG